MFYQEQKRKGSQNTKIAIEKWMNDYSTNVKNKKNKPIMIIFINSEAYVKLLSI